MAQCYLCCQDSQNKIDKTKPTAANNVALLDSSGNIVDSEKQLTPEGIGAESIGTGLWGLTTIPENADLNDYTACGYYGHTSGAVTNNPSSTNMFSLKVFSSCGWHDDHDAISGKTWRYRTQKLTDLYGNEYIRHGETGDTGTVSFGEWKKTLYADSALPALGISFSYWTPTLSGMSSYSYQRGRYVKIGDVAIVSFSIWGIMAGDSTEQIKISGCPLIPADGGYAGGGSLSGYYTTEDVVFTGWTASTDGSFYAYGQITGSGSKWEANTIFQKTEGECGGGGTLMFKISSKLEK